MLIKWFTTYTANLLLPYLVKLLPKHMALAGINLLQEKKQDGQLLVNSGVKLLTELQNHMQAT